MALPGDVFYYKWEGEALLHDHCIKSYIEGLILFFEDGELEAVHFRASG
jgi:hypothetical protein